MILMCERKEKKYQNNNKNGDFDDGKTGERERERKLPSRGSNKEKEEL